MVASSYKGAELMEDVPGYKASKYKKNLSFNSWPLSIRYPLQSFVRMMHLFYGQLQDSHIKVYSHRHTALFPARVGQFIKENQLFVTSELCSINNIYTLIHWDGF